MKDYTVRDVQTEESQEWKFYSQGIFPTSDQTPDPTYYPGTDSLQLSHKGSQNTEVGSLPPSQGIFLTEIGARSPAFDKLTHQLSISERPIIL